VQVINDLSTAAGVLELFANREIQYDAFITRLRGFLGDEAAPRLASIKKAAENLPSIQMWFSAMRGHYSVDAVLPYTKHLLETGSDACGLCSVSC